MPNLCRRILVLDGLSYAQNVGMLTRTAISLGFDGLFVLNNSAKQFDWKVTVGTHSFSALLKDSNLHSHIERAML